LEVSTLKNLLVFLALCSNWAVAETFPSIDAYVAHVTNGQPIEIKVVQTSANGSVFGAVQWCPPDNAPDTALPCLASVFVLQNLKNDGFKEIVHSNPSSGFSGSAMETLDGVEIQSERRFSVRLHNFKPLGSTTYRFALIDQTWHLSGRDVSFCYYDEDEGDACGIQENRSTNFLTGKVIENKLRRNRAISSKTSKTKFPKFPLSKFMIFDEQHGPL
jgi:hypothetical protein